MTHGPRTSVEIATRRQRRARDAKAFAAGVGCLALTAGAVAGWLAWSGYQAARHLEAARDHARMAAAAGFTDVKAVSTAAQRAAVDVRRAGDLVDDPVWRAAAAVPFLGDPLETARGMAAAATDLAGALDHIAPTLEGLSPAQVYRDGRVDLAAVDRLTGAAEALGGSVSRARALAAATPDPSQGAWVPGPLGAGRQRVLDLLTEADQDLQTALPLLRGLPATLGADGPRTIAIAMQSPAEVRAPGGVIGNFALLTADDGRLTLRDVLSNSAVRPLSTMPAGVPADIQKSYGEEILAVPQANLPIDFRAAASIWGQMLKEAEGVVPDTMVSIDPVAVGYLMRATGPVTLTDGRQLTADTAPRFWLDGIYQAFPDTVARDTYQSRSIRQVLQQVVSGDVDVTALVRAAQQASDERRLLVHSRHANEQAAYATASIAGMLPSEGRQFAAVAVNSLTPTKINTFLKQSLTYSPACRVGGVSRLSVTYSLKLPEGYRPTDYQLARAIMTPTGPRTGYRIQFYTPQSASNLSLQVNGVHKVGREFIEAGHPAISTPFMMTSAHSVTATLTWSEHSIDARPTLLTQPLATEAAIAYKPAGDCTRLDRSLG